MTASTTNISSQTGTFVSVSPVVTAFLSACLLSGAAWYAANQETYETSAIYSGVFDILSIFTGFLATFYVFVITKGNSFLEKIKGTRTYGMVLKLLKFTILWSVAMIAASYVLTVINPSKYQFFSLSHWMVFVWIVNIALIAINFARCVSQFSTIVSAED